MKNPRGQLQKMGFSEPLSQEEIDKLQNNIQGRIARLNYVTKIIINVIKGQK